MNDHWTSVVGLIIDSYLQRNITSFSKAKTWMEGFDGKFVYRSHVVGVFHHGTVIAVGEQESPETSVK